MFSKLDNCRKCETGITTLDNVCPVCHQPTGHGSSASQSKEQMLGVGLFILAAILFVVILDIWE